MSSAEPETAKTTIDVERICPACNGAGTSWGRSYCRCCMGDHYVKESVTITHEGAGDAEAIGEAIRNTLGAGDR